MAKVHAAIKNGVTIIPVRLEEDLPRRPDQWTELSSSSNQDDMLVVTQVKAAAGESSVILLTSPLHPHSKHLLNGEGGAAG